MHFDEGHLGGELSCSYSSREVKFKKNEKLKDIKKYRINIFEIGKSNKKETIFKIMKKNNIDNECFSNGYSSRLWNNG